MGPVLSSCVAFTGLAVVAAASAADPWAPPANYYTGATGTGSTLKTQLRLAMSAGHIQRTYGDFRQSAAITDRDPNNSSNILLAYNRVSIPGNWTSGSTWNREHVWPQSRQPGSASNSSRGNLGDPHALRPCNPGINSSRGNKPFGSATTTGGHRSNGVYYFAGDTDKGDITRSLFYSATRWSTSGLTLVNGTPGGNQMGDLSALMAWHYLDVPDNFERRRNHTIFSQAENPSYYTNNRNAFVDHPEFAWSVFVDQANDSKLTLAGGGDSAGASGLNISLGAVLVGETAALTAPITLNKVGVDGTYYEVTTTGDATSAVLGRYNAFAMGSAGSRSWDVGFTAADTASAGERTGTVVIDNLDVTTAGGAGRGANDGDDVVSLSLIVLDHAAASFDALADVDTTQIDFGTIAAGGGDASVTIDVFNLASTPGFTAALDTELGGASGDTSAITLTGAALEDILAGGQGSITATLADTATGSYSATYTLRVFDDRVLPGFDEGTPLTITLVGEVASAGCSPADITTEGSASGIPDGQVTLSDFSYYLTLWSTSDSAADLTTEGSANGIPDGAVTLSDFSFYLTAWSAGCP